MKIDQYKFRNIRKYVNECWSRNACMICLPPQGTFFGWESLKDIRWIGLYHIGGAINYTNRIIMVAHNHTKLGDIWVAPIDATRPETANNKYIVEIRERLEKLVLTNNLRSSLNEVP